MSGTPLISVITVVRNAQPVIQETLDSVFSQTFPAYEYVVLDGASGDGTAETLAGQAGRLAYFESRPDAGIYDAMNRAAGLACGEFLYYLNAGDRLFDAGTLQRVALQLQEPVDFYSGRVRLMSEQGLDLQRHYPEEGPSFDGLWRGCCIAHQASFVRRSVQLGLGGFDTSLRSSADYELWLRLRAAGLRARFSMDTLAWYRDGGLSSSRRTRRLRDLEDVEIQRRHGLLGARAAALLRLFNGHPPLRRRLVRRPGKSDTEVR